MHFRQFRSPLWCGKMAMARGSRKAGLGKPCESASTAAMEIAGFDGTRLQVHEMGEGPALLLLHGLFSSASVNWMKFGTARRLADAGFRVLMPDHRGHGQSEAPADPARWPADVLAMDAECVVEALGIGDDFAAAGYSLGGRTLVRILARGIVRPRAAVLAGMGLQGLLGEDRRMDWFIDLIAGRGQWGRGSPQFLADTFMRANVPHPERLVPLLERQVPTGIETLRALGLPVLVVAGVDDDDNGSAPELAATIPGAAHAAIPGNHMTSVTKPELAAAMIDFLVPLVAGGRWA